MSDPHVHLPAFQGTVRLFPLPNVVLFPQVMLPLHIFEPRYRQMVTESLADDRLIAMAVPLPNGERTAAGIPALHPVVCIGRILTEQRLPDGRFNLLLRGLVRARILEEIPTDRLYRTARVELLTELPITNAKEESTCRQELEDIAQRWLRTLGVDKEQTAKLLHAGVALGALADILTYAVPLEIEVKQQLLTEADVSQRVLALIQHLRSGLAQATGSSPTAPRAFPPDFSAN